jgi:hypothetical protein
MIDALVGVATPVRRKLQADPFSTALPSLAHKTLAMVPFAVPERLSATPLRVAE